MALCLLKGKKISDFFALELVAFEWKREGQNNMDTESCIRSAEKEI